MANEFYVDADDRKDSIIELLTKAFQSGNINFLIGSGASTPAIPLAFSIEQEINILHDSGKEDEAQSKQSEFINSVRKPTQDMLNGVIDSNANQVINSYSQFLATIENILIERKTNILPKQANIFTTNYDLYIEKSSEEFPLLKVNDGFLRTASTGKQITLSSNSFFNTVYNNGNLYNYKVEVPSVNLIKLHGSLSWQKADKEIIYGLCADDDNVGLIAPGLSKFKEAMLERIYYDLLRLYANELDKENSLLMVFGFSFEDEHIRDITMRALKNPTLKLIIFSYNQASTERYQDIFRYNRNVDLICTTDSQVQDFSKFNELIEAVLPKFGV